MLSRIEARLIKISQNFFYILVCCVFCLPSLPFLNVKLEGKENIPKKGRYILAANHQNFFDGFILAFCIGIFKKISFVIAKRALKHGFWQILGTLIGSVLLGNEAEDYQRALKKINRILSHGFPVCIFPEGDISNHKIPRKFKGGVAKLSLDSKSKVIPIYISGTYNLRYFKFWLKKPQVLIRIGKPIELYNYAPICGNNLDDMAAILRGKIIELITQEEFKKVEDINSLAKEPLVSVYESPTTNPVGSAR